MNTYECSCSRLQQRAKHPRWVMLLIVFSTDETKALCCWMVGMQQLPGKGFWKSFLANENFSSPFPSFQCSFLVRRKKWRRRRGAQNLFCTWSHWINQEVDVLQWKFEAVWKQQRTSKGERWPSLDDQEFSYELQESQSCCRSVS